MAVSIFFGHQMGQEQTLRRETLTDRRQMSVRVSFIVEKTRFYTKIPGYVISGKKKEMFCDTELQYGLAS